MSGFSVHPFRVPLASPWRTARGTVTERAGWLVRATRGALAGWGEASPFRGAGTESPAACERALAAVAAHGVDAARRELARAPAARHAVTLALADAAAREAGVPLARHLAEARPPRTEVPVNATLAGGGDVAAAARARVQDGYRALKIKAERDVDATVERVRAVRDAVGRHVELRVDANGAWSRTAAKRALEGLHPLEVAFVEQPLTPRDTVGAAALVAEGLVRVAADEAVTGPRAAERLLTAGAADVIVVKPQRVGGPERALAVARVAAAHDVPLVVTTLLDAAVGRAGALHVAAAAPGTLLASGLATASVLARDVGAFHEHVTHGAMRVPSTPGLDVTMEVPA